MIFLGVGSRLSAVWGPRIILSRNLWSDRSYAIDNAHVCGVNHVRGKVNAFPLSNPVQSCAKRSCKDEECIRVIF